MEWHELKFSGQKWFSLRSPTHSKDINTSLLMDVWQSSHLPMWESVSEVRSICWHASFSLVLLKRSRSIILLFVWHCCSCWFNDWKQHGSSLAGLSLCHNWWGSVINAVELDKLHGTWSPEVKAAMLSLQKADQSLSLGWARLDSLTPNVLLLFKLPVFFKCALMC